MKALVPLFTVILCRLIFGESQSFPVYLSILPIIGGVGLATGTELSFDYVGLLAGLGETFGFSLLNILIKKLMSVTGMHNFESLAILGRLSFLVVLPVWALVDLKRFLEEPALVITNHNHHK